jgi:VWFA-related protein
MEFQMRTVTLIVCIGAASAVLTAGQAQSSQQRQNAPQFRAGVDLMRIDVTVLDKNTRRPITGLRAEDFEVRVGGTPQPIQAVAESGFRSSEIAAASWQTSAARDVVGNLTSAGRLIVVVMDDAQGGLWHGRAGKKVGHKIIDEMGPDDLAAVVFVNKTQFSQDFTRDRRLLRAAVDTFDPIAPRRFAFTHSVATIRNVRNFLSSVARYRRAIIVVTSRGYELSTGPSGPWGFLRDAALNDRDHETPTAQGFTPASRLSHVPIYFFTTSGLTVSTNPLARKPGEDMITIARYAGGRAIVENNAPETAVPDVFAELGAVYTLAYAPTFPLDGKFRFADIEVRRPDVLVLPASGAFRTAREVTATESPKALHLRERSGLLDAVAAPLMDGDLPMTLTTVVLAVKDRPEHAVAVTLALSPTGPATEPQKYDVMTIVYDGEGREELSSATNTVTVLPMLEGHLLPAEVVLKLSLRPGRYNLRVGAQPAGGGPAGSVFTSIVVPDFVKEPLSISGVAIGRAEGRVIGGRESLAPVLPFAPTTVREFAATDHVGALLRVHQRQGRAAAVELETQVFNADEAVVVSEAKAIPQSAFAENTGVEHRYDLPLKTLPLGAYLLRFRVTAAGRVVEREVRFSIR